MPDCWNRFCCRAEPGASFGFDRNISGFSAALHSRSTLLCPFQGAAVHPHILPSGRSMYKRRVKDPTWWFASYPLCSPTVCPPLLLPRHQCAVVHMGMLNDYQYAGSSWWNFMFSWKTPKLPEIKFPSHISIAPYASRKETCFFHLLYWLRGRVGRGHSPPWPLLYPTTLYNTCTLLALTVTEESISMLHFLFKER